MEDRFTRGFLAGVGGGIVMNAWSFFAGSMNMTTHRMVDWAALAIYGHAQPFDFGEIIFAFMAQLFFTGVLGIAFAYLVPLITSRNILFKGWVFSAMTWFLIYGVAMLFKVDGAFPVPLKTPVADFVGATIYGLVLPLALEALTETNAASPRVSMAPAMKPLDRQDDEDTIH